MKDSNLYLDTSVEAEKISLAIYRDMPAWRKIELVEDANRTARQLSFSGICSRHKGETLAKHRRRLLGLVLGERMALHIYGPLGNKVK